MKKNIISCEEMKILDYKVCISKDFVHGFFISSPLKKKVLKWGSFEMDECSDEFVHEYAKKIKNPFIYFIERFIKRNGILIKFIKELEDNEFCEYEYLTSVTYNVFTNPFYFKRYEKSIECIFVKKNKTFADMLVAPFVSQNDKEKIPLIYKITAKAYKYDDEAFLYNKEISHITTCLNDVSYEQKICKRKNNTLYFANEDILQDILSSQKINIDNFI